MSKQVALTILSQLGGHKFLTMTGAKNLVSGSDSLSFTLPARLAVRGINRFRVTLQPSDTYTLEAWRLRNLDLQPRGIETGIYAEALRDTFRSMTGLETSL
ncbi:hypothetical protein [Acidocella aminolytica]|uniref:Uncharacterized protein n=1 Tax=Acidocella aminolytica 101 = DSM 11237 TaxID=1120923 RepID=A0A0D6PG04_9PROT|nr:hypothetical protein [Acidocella aminolytica]GAN79794.1 hypothetical protein Aam_030_027 [Acidocella aminolytica 101 = DSM 11237]GBQ32072.1 hypothetical protein AA11237_0062 [Acidocella aminolytica 101 = DSM 11237]SHF35468.1 hypothetical protein SAMN02746095_02938 [Acidocella aminolytica 101 = DSM 11237]